ncbi:hypothetical protein ACQ4PT_001292 [Festuca glaucescens]
MVAMPPGPLRTQHGYVVLGGEFPLFANDWAIATLVPDVGQNHFDIAIATIQDHLQQLGLEVRSRSMCAMGTALIRFNTITDRDDAVNLIPHHLAADNVAHGADNVAPAAADEEIVAPITPAHNTLANEVPVLDHEVPPELNQLADNIEKQYQANIVAHVMNHDATGVNNFSDYASSSQQADPISAIKNLISNFTDNAAELLPKLSGAKFSSASCQIIETEDQGGLARKCILQFDATCDVFSMKHCSVQITKISDDYVMEINKHANFPQAKKQKNELKNVATVRRSGRIAGFFDEQSAREAALEHISEHCDEFL